MTRVVCRVTREQYVDTTSALTFQMRGPEQTEQATPTKNMCRIINEFPGVIRASKEETRMIKKWSELSDVVYTCTRARWSGHPLAFPLKKWQFYLGVIYMLPKYTGRFLFYRRAGKKAGADKTIRCVRNPQKLYKLDGILAEQKIRVNKPRLLAICKKQLRYWPLLP